MNSGPDWVLRNGPSVSHVPKWTPMIRAVRRRATNWTILTMRFSQASLSGATADNDVAVRALDNRSNLGLLRGGNLEFVESLLQVVEEGVPLLWRDLEITVGIDH